MTAESPDPYLVVVSIQESLIKWQQRRAENYQYIVALIVLASIFCGIGLYATNYLTSFLLANLFLACIYIHCRLIRMCNKWITHNHLLLDLIRATDAHGFDSPRAHMLLDQINASAKDLSSL